MRRASKARQPRRKLRSAPPARRLLWPMVGAILLPAVFDVAGLVKQVEEPLVRVAAHQVKPLKSLVTVVQTSDDDYREIFHSRRPLDPDKMGQVIDAIAALGPRAIAVDIDTSDPVYRGLARRKWLTFASPGDGAETGVEVPVVWATRATYSHRADLFYTEEVLGGAGASRIAVAEVIADGDGAVRRYRRSFATDRGKLLALPIELLKAGGMIQPDGEDGERTIDFYGDTSGRHRVHYWAGAVLQAGSDRDIAATKPLRGQIVLLGGAFRGVDEQETPLGWMRGVELLAHIAETDAGNRLPTTRLFLLVIVFIGAVLIAFCFETKGMWTAVLVSLSGIVCSFLLYWSYTRLMREALLVGIALVVIVGQRIYLKIKQVAKEKGKGSEHSPERNGARVEV